MLAGVLAIASTRSYGRFMQPLRNLGGYIREQRNVSQISLRQLAAAAGVSNPYLSQIERGLRKPSADILQQIAKALRISAEALYVQAGILDERLSGSEVAHAIHADLQLSDRQKQVLLEIYHSFSKENQSAPRSASQTAPVSGEPVADSVTTTASAPANDPENKPVRKPAKAAKKAAPKARKKAAPAKKTTAAKRTSASQTSS